MDAPSPSKREEAPEASSEARREVMNSAMQQLAEARREKDMKGAETVLRLLAQVRTAARSRIKGVEGSLGALNKQMEMFGGVAADRALLKRYEDEITQLKAECRLDEPIFDENDLVRVEREEVEHESGGGVIGAEGWYVKEVDARGVTVSTPQEQGEKPIVLHLTHEELERMNAE